MLLSRYIPIGLSVVGISMALRGWVLSSLKGVQGQCMGRAAGPTARPAGRPAQGAAD